MPAGPGLYDKECTEIRQATGGEMVILLVFRGFRGSGFSVQTSDPTLLLEIPYKLRDMADEIERSQHEALKQGGVGGS